MLFMFGFSTGYYPQFSLLHHTSIMCEIIANLFGMHCMEGAFTSITDCIRISYRITSTCSCMTNWDQLFLFRQGRITVCDVQWKGSTFYNGSLDVHHQFHHKLYMLVSSLSCERLRTQLLTVFVRSSKSVDRIW